MGKRTFLYALHRDSPAETFRIGDEVRSRLQFGFFEHGDAGVVITLSTINCGCGRVEQWAGIRATKGKFKGHAMDVPLFEIEHVNNADIPPCRNGGVCPYR